MKIIRPYRASRDCPTRLFVFALIVSFIAASVSARAASLEGHVRNGTTNQPVAGAKVQFIQLQQGMTPVDSATSDAQGVFRFDGVEKFQGSPALLQVEYQGATYSQPLISPQAMANGIEFLVYDATRDKKIVSLKEHAIFLRPAGDELMVIEQISIDNESKPPRTYVNPEGTYLFTLPGTPKDGVQASITGAVGMPIPQTPVGRERANSFAITYPMRPGESQVRIQYTLPYTSPLSFTKPVDETAEQMHIVTPGEGVQLEGEGLESLGKEPTTGMLAYRVTPAKNAIRLEVSGEAPPEQAEADAGGASSNIVEVPDPATQRKWIILSALGLVMLGGFAYLYAHS